jgi:hypothetical protein
MRDLKRIRTLSNSKKLNRKCDLNKYLPKLTSNSKSNCETEIDKKYNIFFSLLQWKKRRKKDSKRGKRGKRKRKSLKSQMCLKMTTTRLKTS